MVGDHGEAAVGRKLMGTFRRALYRATVANVSDERSLLDRKAEADNVGELPRRSSMSPRDLAVWRNIGRAYSSGLVGFVIAGAVLGFLFQPLLRFADPYELEVAGCTMAMGMVGTWLLIALERSRPAILFGVAIWIAGIYVLADLFGDAAENARVNDVRCAAVQHEMLTVAGRQQDDAAMMQALGCRPQGLEMPASLAAPAPPLLPYADL